MSLTRAGEVGLVVDLGVRFASRLPERGDRRALPREVPDAGRHEAVRPRHTRHIRESGDGVAHEMHHELRHRHVERAVRLGDVLRRGPPDVDAGMPLPRSSDERLGWIDRGHGRGPEPVHELDRQSARPAAHNEHQLSRVNTGEVGEDR